MMFIDNIQPAPRSRLARRDNPQTSHDAAKRAEQFAASHSGRILNALNSHGGMTTKELEQHCGGLNHFQIGKRMALMRDDGLIESTGLVRDGCTVWRAV